MTPRVFLKRVVGLYEEARKVRFPHARICRGRSHSVASDVEDLFARYLIAIDRTIEQINVDQSLTLHRPKLAIYPDIIVQKGGKAVAFFDLKTDMGWQRDGLYPLCRRHARAVKLLRGKEAKLWEAEDDNDKKVARVLPVSESAVYAVVIVSGTNIDPKVLDIHMQKACALEPYVRVLVLSRGAHPNHRGVKLREIAVNNESFDKIARLIGSP